MAPSRAHLLTAGLTGGHPAVLAGVVKPTGSLPGGVDTVGATSVQPGRDGVRAMGEVTVVSAPNLAGAGIGGYPVAGGAMGGGGIRRHPKAARGI